MDLLEGERAFESAVALLPHQLRDDLLTLELERRFSAQEVRLILGQKPIVRFNNRSALIEKCREINKESLWECFVSLCDNAVHSHQSEVAQGYISLKNGHRAALSGRAVYEGKKLIGMREINAVVIRVARRYKGCAKKLIDRAFTSGICNLLIIGAPASGKTTVLRDLASSLGSGALKEVDRVAVVDERGEITDCCEGCCVLSGYDKADGLMLAVRNLSPQVILCDEIFSEREIEAVIKAQNCGAAVITTIHAKNREELLQKDSALHLLRQGGFKKAAFLSEFPYPTALTEVVSVEDIFKIERCGFTDSDRGGIWSMALTAAKEKSFPAL